MFESVLTADQLTGLAAALALVDRTVDDAARIDQIRALEEIKAVAAAAQAQLTADFVASQEEAQVESGAGAKGVGKGIAAQVGLAKRDSPARARRYVGWAKVLTTELPQTLAALRRGETTEWRAMIVARETIWLSAPHRAVVDADLAGRLARLGDRQVEAEAKRIAYRLDPVGFTKRARRAERDRRVSLRPAPDTMARLSGLLPVAQGVAAFAALSSHADGLIAGGDTRGRGQIMADTLVERITGQAGAAEVAVRVNLVMTDRTLFNRRGDGDHPDDTGEAAGADEPAHLDAYGPIPADLARRLVTDAPNDPDSTGPDSTGPDSTGPDGTDADTGTAAKARVWLRRLYTHPSTGALVAMESRSRCFDGALREFLVLRDQVCRTPWCDAVIRHADHPRPVEDGGATSAANGQGLCAACNYAKQAPGWEARPGPTGATDQVLTTTPTGHPYLSRAPDAPGSAMSTGSAARAPDVDGIDHFGQIDSPAERALRHLVQAA